MTEPNAVPPDSTLAREPEDRLAQLWRRGQRPDVWQFLTAAGDLPPDQVVAVLAVDQRERWLAGERRPAEAYLEHCPTLGADGERALELVYGEFLLREELGEEPAPDEYLRRFPQFAARLAQQVEVHRAMAERTSVLSRTLKLGADNSGTGPTGPVVPGYEVLGELGRGGMGVVYSARQEALNRLVALKMIRDGHPGPDELTRLRREAEAVARLQHPHIVQIYEVGEHDGRPFLALEFVEGGSLERALAGQPQPARVAAGLLATIASAADYAHRQGVVHRDLKPGNVLLSFGRDPRASALPSASRLNDAVPKITDFGLAKRLECEPGTTTPSGALLGTPSYMAPEQAAGSARDIGPVTDVYALGAILYEMLTGRPPFRSTSLVDTLLQVRTEEPVPPRRLQSTVPRDLETICLKCLQKPSARRYASAAALAEDLQRFLEGRAILARPAGLPERARKWAARRPALAGLLAVSVVAALLMMGGGWWAAEFERTQRRRAEDSFHQALEAVEQMLTEVGAVDLADVPQMGPVRRRLLERALAFLNRFLRERGDDPAVRFEAARVHGRCGDILALQSRSDEARQHYARALELLNRVPAGPDRDREEARSRNNLGTLLKRLNQFTEAEDDYRRALALRERLAEGQEPDSAADLAATRYLLGALLEPQAGRQDEAEALYRQALEAQEKLAERLPGQLEYPRDAARTLNNLGILQKAGGRRGDARESFARAEARQEKLVGAAPEVPRYRHELARTLMNLGGLEKSPARATDAYERARQLLADLANEHRDVPEYRYELAGSHYSLGRAARQSGALDGAERALCAAADVCRRLTEDLPDEPRYANFLGLVHGERGRVREEAGRSHDAEADYRRSAALHDGLVMRYAAVHEYHSNLGIALERLAWLLVRRGGLEEPDAVVQLVLAGAARTPGGVLVVGAALQEARESLERAVREQELALEQVNRPDSPYAGYLLNHQALLVEAHLRLGDHVAAAAVVDRLRRRGGPDEQALAAGFLARCMTLAVLDGRLTPAERQQRQDDYAGRAVALLRDAMEGLVARPERVRQLLEGMKRLPEYRLLRERPAFRKLMEDAAQRVTVRTG
jgi:serine/threonine-protein kinase